ncbi:hypothetical protein U9M48_005374 [Paspalum notatum var. saurae]|uniref:Uncharacterized protein n=1 Tax=Paspalum notatum var. saurae TaxID=547442 RepID=A0AAQ3SJV6_PASNO
MELCHLQQDTEQAMDWKPATTEWRGKLLDRHFQGCGMAPTDVAVDRPQMSMAFARKLPLPTSIQATPAATSREVADLTSVAPDLASTTRSSIWTWIRVGLRPPWPPPANARADGRARPGASTVVASGAVIFRGRRLLPPPRRTLALSPARI